MSIKTIQQIQQEVIDEFEEIDDWMDRYAFLIDLGNTLEPLSEKDKIPSNLIEGCQSRVWIAVTHNPDGTLSLQCDSDALIVKGIAALLLRIFDGQKREDIVSSDLFFIERIGLREHLSPTRSNGLAAMITQIKQAAALSLMAH